MRKIKLFALAGFASVLLLGGLTIWAGISAVQAVSTKFTASVQPLPCWNKAQSLIALQPWMERPALDHLAALKVACLESKHQPIDEGSTI